MKRLRPLLVLLSTIVLARAEVVSPNTKLSAREEQIIAATKPDAAPRFNGMRIIGIRPRTPFVHTMSVSGTRPIRFSAPDLPTGLKLDRQTGIITGMLSPAGDYAFKARAQNSAGAAETEIRIVCGDKIALSPPMGW